tara:strand:+ start:465 stop:602 length:138 start_codon:yes stop_codon:yes gene_type:complete
LYAKGLTNGERNGSLFGMKLNIVLKNAEEIDKSKNEKRKNFNSMV